MRQHATGRAEKIKVARRDLFPLREDRRRVGASHGAETGDGPSRGRLGERRGERASRRERPSDGGELAERASRPSAPARRGAPSAGRGVETRRAFSGTPRRAARHESRIASRPAVKGGLFYVSRDSDKHGWRRRRPKSTVAKRNREARRAKPT